MSSPFSSWRPSLLNYLSRREVARKIEAGSDLAQHAHWSLISHHPCWWSRETMMEPLRDFARDNVMSHDRGIPGGFHNDANWNHDFDEFSSTNCTLPSTTSWCMKQHEELFKPPSKFVKSGSSGFRWRRDHSYEARRLRMFLIFY